MHSIVFMVGFTRMADGQLAANHLQHHVAICVATHSACGMLAFVSQNFVKRSAGGDRGARILTGAIGVLGLWSGGTSATGSPALTSVVTVGVVVLVTAGGEICFRLSTRRKKRDGSGAASSQADLPADKAA
jgi:hypothetical protein